MVGLSDQEKLEKLAAEIQKAQEASESPQKKAALGSFGPDRPAVRYVHIGSDFVATVMVPMFAGGVADRYMGTQPVLMLALLFVGFVVGLYRMVRALEFKPGPRGTEERKK